MAVIELDANGNPPAAVDPRDPVKALIFDAIDALKARVDALEDALKTKAGK